MGLRKKWHGVGTKVGGLAYRGDLTYALNCIFSLKICIFRLEMAVFNLKMFILSVKIRLIYYMSKPFS